MEEPTEYADQAALLFPQTICAECFKKADTKTMRRLLVIYCEHHRAAAVMVREHGSLSGRWVVFTQMSAGELTDRLSNGIIDHWCTLKSLAWAVLLGSLLAAGVLWADHRKSLELPVNTLSPSRHVPSLDVHLANLKEFIRSSRAITVTEPGLALVIGMDRSMEAGL
jgi:hypothetical protein